MEATTSATIATITSERMDRQNDEDTKLEEDQVNVNDEMEIRQQHQERQIEQTTPEEEVNANNTNNNKRSYQGFSTSINNLFTDPEDCCMFFCFGIFLSTRTRYLYANEYHPNEENIHQGYKYYCTAILRHYIVPVGLIYSAGICFAIGSTTIGFVFIAVFIIYLIKICRELVASRVKFRLGILDKIRDDNNNTDTAISQLQEIQNEKLSHDAHKLCCGCYPIDDDDNDGNYTQRSTRTLRRRGPQYQAASTADDIIDDDEEIQITQNYQQTDEPSPNFCTNVWKFISNTLCCGKLCNAWCMCFGICSLAQESREMKYLIHDKSRLYIDFYTFEPFTEYYSKIQQLRQTSTKSFYSHINTISKLSSKMLGRYLYFLVLCFIFAILGNGMDNWLVLLATFMQAFIIIYFIQWKNNRFIVSMDAVIKYFTLGFFFSTTLAQLFEQLLQIVFSILLFIPYYIFDRDEFNTIISSIISNQTSNSTGYGYSNYDNNNRNAENNVEYVDDYYYDSSSTTNTTSIENSPTVTEIMETVSKNHPILFIVYFFFLSYIVAAVTEELCKYFGYLVLTHPENIPEMNNILNAGNTENELEMTSINVNASNNNATSNTTYTTTTSDSTNFTIDEDEDENEDEVVVVNNENRITLPSMQQQQYQEESLETIRIRTMIHMVTVATGFACAENISYIFGMSGGNLDTEIMVLVMRSLLPVHPICAAIQSIGVCKSNLLHNNTDPTTTYTKSNYNIGRIILPSVILHGSFDFFLFFLGYLALYFCGEDEMDMEVDDNMTTTSNITCSDSMDMTINVLGYVTPFLFAVGGIMYYVVQSRILKQRLRGIDLNSATIISGVL